jgi:hypothetical protein
MSRVAHTAEAGEIVCDIPGWSVQAVLLQAFNTENTKDHEAARSEFR